MNYLITGAENPSPQKYNISLAKRHVYKGSPTFTMGSKDLNFEPWICKGNRKSCLMGNLQLSQTYPKKQKMNNNSPEVFMFGNRSLFKVYDKMLITKKVCSRQNTCTMYEGTNDFSQTIRFSFCIV